MNAIFAATITSAKLRPSSRPKSVCDTNETTDAPKPRSPIRRPDTPDAVKTITAADENPQITAAAKPRRTSRCRVPVNSSNDLFGSGATSQTPSTNAPMVKAADRS